ncbi:MAG: hypothetical protein AAB793_00855, partial [Patescibacteria group bacterium]
YPDNRNTNTSTAVNPQNYGQTHSYNVLLRGNGEIVSWATISITNGESTPVSQLTFKTGNMSPRLFEVWQEMSGGYQYQYKKLTVQQSGKTATVTLAQSISQNQTGTLIINYRGFGAIKKGLFGKMKFDFQTMESNDRIRSARVVAEADVDLYIKGDKAKVSYVESAPSSFGKVAGGSMAMENALSSGLSDRSLSSGIGGYYPTNSTNSITKSTTDLLAGDVFHVRGVYASSWLGMYWTGFAWFIFIAAAAIAAIVLARKYWSRIMPPKSPSNKTPEQKPEQAAPSDSPLPFWRTIWGAIVMGFLNAVATIFLVFLVPFGTNSLISFMGYGYSDDFMRIGLTLLLALISFILFVGTIFGPSIYFGIRYGKQYGFIVFGAQITSLIFLAFFGFYFFAVMARNIF